MKIIIKTVTRQVVHYIIDSLSGNYGWEPLSSIDQEIIARFMTTISTDSEHDLYDIELSDNCKLEASSSFDGFQITLRYREHLATLDSKDFEKVVIV